MEVFLASPAVTSAATEVLTDVSKILELCDAALAMARERGDMEMAEIIARVRTSLAQKGTRHRSPSTKKHSAKRPRKAQRERKRDVIAPSPAAAEEAMAQAPPTTRGIPVSAAGKRQVVPRLCRARMPRARRKQKWRQRRKRRRSTWSSGAGNRQRPLRRRGRRRRLPKRRMTQRLARPRGRPLTHRRDGPRGARRWAKA